MFQFFKSTIIVSILSEFGWDESTLPPTPPIPPPLVMIGSTLEGQPTGMQSNTNSSWDCNLD